MPTQYLGSEINTIKKDLQNVELTFALVFPDLYEIGTSHFGLQILYSILNRHEKIAAERFFTPAPDIEKKLLEKQIPCLSMESKRELKQFDVIGISLLYELNFTNILTMLHLSGIPFYSQERTNTFPLIIGGGPCAFNPEPLADFFDAFVIGDGEDVAVQISETVLLFKQQGGGEKKHLLRQLSKIDGVYVPSFYGVSYDSHGRQIVQPRHEDCQNVRRAFLPVLSKETFPGSPILPFAKPVHDRLRLEIARGCSRGCRFCQAGMIYRPVRERSLDDLVEIAETSLKATGYSDISLLSLSAGDYSDLSGLMIRLLALEKGHCNAISLPSVRAEKLTPELMAIIKSVRKTGFTIAPEAGSQRLRDIINKNLTEESIRKTVENAFSLGWKNIKLYFMMGLPFETMADINAICTLSKQLAAAHAKGKKRINVSTASFIPKAHTPFQWCCQDTVDQTREKLQFLKDHLRHPKVNLKWQRPEMSLLEGVWARGDRRLSALLVSAWEKGCRLDSWSDKFDFGLWQAAFESTGIDPGFYTRRQRDKNEPLPWDHIDTGLSPQFLKKEYDNAKDQILTLDCRENDCTGCGICDFDQIKPVLYKADSLAVQQYSKMPQDSPQLPDDAFKKFELLFSKLGPAKFFGHLELATIVQRAVKRAGFFVKYSKGFNPSMRISFENALPVGMESEEESIFIYLEKDMICQDVIEKFNAQLPVGITILTCRPFDKTQYQPKDISVYHIRLQEGELPREQIESFFSLSEFVVEDTGKKRKTDLRSAVDSLIFLDNETIKMVLQKVNARTIRPAEILDKCFHMDETLIQRAAIRKIKQG